jgi:hypothetical protein
LATYSLNNFARIEGQFILIYDSIGQLRHSIIPLESNFYARAHNCVIDTNGNNVDKYIILDFSSSDEATQAMNKLVNLKESIQYNINWSDLTNIPTSLSGYGITDAYTKSEVNQIVISGGSYNMSNYYTSSQTNANFLSANTILNESVGITLNNKYIAGVKNYIEQNDKLIVPENYEYNVFRFNVDGIIDLDGEINIM